MSKFFFGIYFVSIFSVYLQNKNDTMKQKYLYIFLFVFCIPLSIFAQDKGNNALKADPIEGLQIYPNPTTNNRVYVTTESNTSKDIDIYDLLGKKVFSTTTSTNSRELNLSALKSGVYLIRIKEKDTTVTRKLVLK